jgi:hypothetical protein
MPKKKKEETIEDILDRMDEDIMTIREKIEGQIDDDNFDDDDNFEDDDE